MKHYASTKFWQCFDELPQEIQKLARRNYVLLKENPAHPSLHFKAVYKAVIAAFELAYIIELSEHQFLMVCSGFGSEVMQSMTNYWANKALELTPKTVRRF